MNELLLLNGKPAALKPGSVRRNLQINDIAEVKDRRANYSNTIDLPSVPQNVALFEFLGVAGNNSLKPYRRIRADYYVNGIPQVINGFAVIKESDPGRDYKIVIYDGISDLAELLKGKKLSDLNFADLNHNLTTATVIESQANDSGYIYALGNFGFKYYSEYKAERIAPSVYVSTLWDKIFAEAGRTYGGDFFQTNEDFKTEVVSPAKGYQVQDVPLTVTDLGSVGTEVLNEYENSPNIIMKSFPFGFDTVNASEVTIVGDGVLQVLFTGVLKLNFVFSYFCGQSTYLNIQSKLNGNQINSQVFDYLQTSKSFSLTLNVIAGDEISLTVSASDTGFYNQEVEPEINDFNEPNPPEETIDGRYEINFSLSGEAGVQKEDGGQFIDFALMVSDMDQQSFVKDVMTRFGLIMQPLRNSNSYAFIQFEDLLNKKETAEDWSDKLDVLGPEAYGVEYAKRNIASYKYPQDIVDKAFDGTLVVDNENAPAERQLFASPYEIPLKSHVNQGVQMYGVPLWEEATEDGVLVTKLKQTAAKLFRVQRIANQAAVRLFDEANPTAIALPAYLTLNNISLQYYIGNYYKAFGNLVSRAKNRKAIFNFNEIDIYNLDFFRLKFLRQTGRFYYLNLLSAAPGKLAEADLVEISQFSENLAPTVLGVYVVNMSFRQTRQITINQLTNFTSPLYFDPEFDPVKSVLFTGGFNSNVLLKDKTGAVINTQTEINAEDFPVTLEDAGNLTGAHEADFTFKIKDTGSRQFSEVQGTIDVNVGAYQNQAPTADAGEDATLLININEANPYPTFIGLFGDQSFDNTGEIVSFVWAILNQPFNSEAFIENSNTGTPNAVLMVPTSENSLGAYEIQLTVTDEFGLSDVDIVNITVNQNFGGGGELPE